MTRRVTLIDSAPAPRALRVTIAEIAAAKGFVFRPAWACIDCGALNTHDCCSLCTACDKHTPEGRTPRGRR
jgi:hypothetical protein